MARRGTIKNGKMRKKGRNAKNALLPFVILTKGGCALAPTAVFVLRTVELRAKSQQKPPSSGAGKGAEQTAICDEISMKKVSLNEKNEGSFQGKLRKRCKK
ncbi:MAG: hypothetical protein KBS74_08115 [Clostridiales bacterium]|nr:hypothetical protein [Candidatus Cacconaster stercorequi]